MEIKLALQRKKNKKQNKTQKPQNQQKPPNQKPSNFESEFKSRLDGNLIPRPHLAFNFRSFLTHIFTILFLYLKGKGTGQVRRKVS